MLWLELLVLRLDWLIGYVLDRLRIYTYIYIEYSIQIYTYPHWVRLGPKANIHTYTYNIYMRDYLSFDRIGSGSSKLLSSLSTFTSEYSIYRVYSIWSIYIWPNMLEIYNNNDSIVCFFFVKKMKSNFEFLFLLKYFFFFLLFKRSFIFLLQSIAILRFVLRIYIAVYNHHIISYHMYIHSYINMCYVYHIW